MGFTIQKLSPPLIFLILIIDATAIESDDTNHRSPGRARIIKQYSGTRPEPILCNDEGFQADPHNCGTFYRCVKSGKDKYTSFRFQCGPGTVYDPDKEVCNHPQNTRRLECGGVLPLITDDSQINEVQGQMFNDIPSPITINNPIYNPNTLEISTITSTKVTIPSYSNHHTTKQSTASTSESHHPWMNPIYGDHNAIDMKPQSTASKIPNPVLEVDICTSDGFIGDSEDCRKFYRCVSIRRGEFTRYEFSCTEGTIWDDFNQICNHVWAVKRTGCGTLNHQTDTSQPQKQNVSKNIRDHTTQQQLQIAYGTKVTQTQTQISDSSVNQNQTQINYGDRLHQNEDNSNKQNQTQISHGSAISQSQLQINYGHKGIQTQLQIDHSNEASQNQVQIIDNTVLTTSTNKNIPNYSTSMSTQNYYTTPQVTGNEDNEDIGYGNSKPDLPPSLSPITTTESNLIGTQCVSSGFMGDDKNCKIFYRCVENNDGGFIKHVFNCAEGTLWDPEINACNHAWAVKKCGGTIFPDIHKVDSITEKVTTSTPIHTQSSTDINLLTTSTPDVEYESNDIPGYGSSDNDISTTITSSTQPPIPIDHLCKTSGYVEDKYDCTKFYKCVDDNNGGFIHIEHTCSNGTLWDNRINACNYASAVDRCGKTSKKPMREDIDNSPENVNFGTTTSKPVVTTVSTTESSSLESGGKCTQSGFIGDSNNCNVFYRCVDDGNGSYTKFEFKCAEGTLWHDEIKACNHAWAVPTCKVGGSLPVNDENVDNFPSSHNSEAEIGSTTLINVQSTSTETVKHETESQLCVSSGFFGDENHCEKFYRCVDTGLGSFIRYEYVCGEGTVWDQGINACNHAWAVEKCGTGKNNTTHKPNEIPQINTETTTISSDENHIQKPISKPVDSAAVCTSEGFYGDKNDCRKFYRCVNTENGTYTTYNFICGDGTVWDQELQVCNHESQGKCSNSASGDLQNNVSQPQPSITTVTDQYYTSSTISTTSSGIQCELEGFFAVPNNCKNFIRCVPNNQNGFTKYEFTCSEGTVWVQEMLTCDHSTGDGYCNPQLTNVENQQTTERYELTTSKHTETENQNDENDNNLVPLPAASDICASEGSYPNKKDCRRFYKCVHNGKGGYDKIDYTCSEGTAWDSDIQTCNNIDKVASCKGSVMQDENIQTTENTIITSTLSTTATSNISHKPVTNNDLQHNDTCNSEGYFGNSQDCKKFYRCVNNGKGSYTKYDFICAEGTIWDKDVTICNHPENVVNPSCNSKQSSSTTEDSSFNGPTTSTTENTSETSKNPVNTKINCTKAGFFSNPDDCKKFYRCVDWDGNGTKFSVFHFECGEGTIWDPELETCNHENSVYPPRDCSGSHSQSSATEGTSTTEKETLSTIESTTINIEENSTTELSGEGTTEQLGESTTQHSIESTTNQPTESTTDKSEQSTTEHSGQSTTEKSVESTTEQLGESTTAQSGESTTNKSEESTTENLGESTTEKSVESTTEQLGESTTAQSGESTTNKSEESTTEHSGESTTEKSVESTTDKSEESTTEHSGQSTTEKSIESTTVQSGESTTEQTGESTTELSGESTTEKSDQSTTERSEESTTEQLGESTTEQLNESTTGNSGEGTTENLTENSTTDQSIAHNNVTTESITETSTESIATENCPTIDNDQHLFVCPTSFRRHPKYCNLFYQCDENDESHDLKIAMFTCPNNKVYDETKIKCVENSKADKPCDGDMAQKRRVKRKDRIGNNFNYPIVVTETSFACNATGYYPFEVDGDCSPGFLKCTMTKSNKLRGLVFQCPSGYMYWKVSKRCEPIYKIKDCKRSFINDWTMRWEIPIEIRNVAW